MNTPLSQLEDIDAYRRLFMDVNLWRPYVQEVCRRHDLAPCTDVRTGIPGTCPTFLVEQRWVVKFFGRLFDGAQSFAVEKDAARLVQHDPRIPTASLAASGELGSQEWPWPYLVFAYIPGVSIGQRMDQLSGADRLRVAGELGGLVQRLHALPLEGSGVFPNSHAPYLRFLESQRVGVVERQREWDSLPPQLVAQIADFLPPCETLVDLTRPPHLIHADLTRDHLLGTLQDGHWRSLALIDFGDARTGDLLYELGALHLDLFAGDRRMLEAFLKAYELPEEQRVSLPRKAMATALLHQFDLFQGIREQVRQAASLEALAQKLWAASEAASSASEMLI